MVRNDGKMLFTSSIAAEMEVTKKNVVITSLQPGPMDTIFFARANMLDTQAGKGKKDDPALVAQQGFDALMSGKAQVIGGSFKNKIQSTAAKFMTESQGAAAQSKGAKPESLKKFTKLAC